jgi:hypothetical protein
MKLYTLKITALLLLGLAYAQAQTPAEEAEKHLISETAWTAKGQYFWMNNGRLWKARTSSEKLVYLIGWYDGLMAMVITNQKLLSRNPDQVNLNFPDHMTFGEAVQALDDLYRDSLNIPIPIQEALRVIDLKASGGTPEQVEEILALERGASRITGTK